MAPCICECSHAQGYHKSNGAPFPFPRLYGLCLIDGCDCMEFRQSEDDEGPAE